MATGRTTGTWRSLPETLEAGAISGECKPTAKVATLVLEPDSVPPFKGAITRRESKADTGTQELREANGESTCLAPGGQ